MKNTTEKFHKKVNHIPDRAKTEARPCEAEARPSQLKKLPRGRLEPRQMPRGLHPCFLQGRPRNLKCDLFAVAMLHVAQGGA